MYPLNILAADFQVIHGKIQLAAPCDDNGPPAHFSKSRSVSNRPVMDCEISFADW